MDCIRWFKIFLHFCFWNDTLRNKNRCENIFHFFVFSVNAFEKPTFDDEKNCKNQVFHVFYQFCVTQKLLPGYLILGAKTDFWASSSGIQKSEKQKITKNHFFNLGWRDVAKITVFNFVPCFPPLLNPRAWCSKICFSS